MSFSKYFAFVFSFIILSTSGFAQELSTPSFTLSGIGFSLEITGIADSVDSAEIIFVNGDRKFPVVCDVTEGKIEQEVFLNESGNYTIESNELQIVPVTIRVIPGWFSLIPPLLAIFMALVFRQVLISLLAGIYVGAIFIFNYEPFTAMLRVIDTIIVNTLVDHDRMVVILFTLMFGGVIGLITNNGGAAGISNLIIKLAKKSRSGMISSWLMGIAIFFDDYSNALIVGNMMRPITDILKISREKLSYIVDSTSAPIASIFIISSWIGFEVGLIDAGLKSIGSTENSYAVFIQTIPYRFYPIAALLFVFITSYMRRDFGAMYKAEMRARTKGEVFAPGAVIDDLQNEGNSFYTGTKSRWYNGVIPILVIIIGTVVGLAYTGIESLKSSGITEYGLQEIISGADSFSALLWASFFACIVAVVMSVSQKILSFDEAMNAFLRGVKSMLFACMILTLAWSIGAVTSEMKTADYLISILSEALNPKFLPVIVFVICGAISFATGTSYGTMAIVIPIIIPLADKMTEVAAMSGVDSQMILYGVVSSVLAGSVWGDHCSPISDTTILSSMASRCNHVDHVRTQLPYAVLVGVVCMLLGDIPSAFGLSPYISILAIIAALIGFLFVFGKKVPDAEIS
ncbi:Na+/H+ antiporter NhaC family protein [Bacteroidota bacterium]